MQVCLTSLSGHKVFIDSFFGDGDFDVARLTVGVTTRGE